MPRYARLEMPGVVHHLVSRFVNEEFRFSGSEERQAYLERIPHALKRSDWSILNYCNMSSHIHHGGIRGRLPSASFIKPLHTATAQWLNRRQDRLGPVFAERHRSIACDPQHAALMIAYIHNNPVRAGLVRDPADSDWSSHRAYLGLVKPPPWLDVQRGLDICGFDASPSGRLSFHEFVLSRSGDPRSDEISGTGLAKVRARIRAVLGSSLECSWPSLEGGPAQTRLDLFAPRGRRIAWPGNPQDVVSLVAQQVGIDLRLLLSGNRMRHIVAARRMLLHLWTVFLGRPQNDMRALLGISAGAASKLLRADIDWDGVNRACELLDNLLRGKK
jgi:REP element-mobilizing transposase RayT